MPVIADGGGCRGRSRYARGVSSLWVAASIVVYHQNASLSLMIAHDRSWPCGTQALPAPAIWTLRATFVTPLLIISGSRRMDCAMTENERLCHICRYSTIMRKRARDFPMTDRCDATAMLELCWSYAGAMPEHCR